MRFFKQRRSVGAIATVAAATLLLASCSGGSGGGGAAGGDKEPIRVGVIMPTTGQMSVLGQDQGNAVKVVLDWANENGGIDGHPIEYFEADSQSDAAVASNVAQRLIDQNDVDIIIGSYSSGLSAAMLPVAQRNDVILWEVGSVSTSINADGNSNFFRTIGNAATYAQASVDYILEVLTEEWGQQPEDIKVAVINEDGAFGMSVGEAYDEILPDTGLDVVYRQTYPITTPDFTPMISQVKAADPEVLLLIPSVADSLLFWEQAAVQELDLRAAFGTSGFTSTAFPERFGDDGIEGVYGIEPPALANMSLESLDPQVGEDTQLFLDTFSEKYDKACLVHCGDGIGGAYILVTDVLPRAIADSGEVTAESIIAAASETDIETGGTPQGFGASFNTPATKGDSTSGDNSRGIASIMQWQTGELKVVFPSAIASADPIEMPSWSGR
ncbi:ABC transporter substrate-binding protein [Leucobacter celer]|uniref:ABC transporter substrate-binding protein n=1 Tax=Leucobacter celer TaxID=668625 RepID=UPI0006A7BF15|nr:ABC transporter substrate-binding protein [Leucobacter celer]